MDYNIYEKSLDFNMNNYIAMNRFRIALGRETHLDNVKGFQKFNLLKGPTSKEHTLYTSHSIWNSKDDFENWKTSEAFRKAHRGGGQHQGIYLGHPEFEGFEVIL